MRQAARPVLRGPLGHSSPAPNCFEKNQDQYYDHVTRSNGTFVMRQRCPAEDADDQAGETVPMRAIVLPHRDSWFNTADMIPERRAAE